jgi:uncharacterized membrane protein YbhN (UPF0104 family)
MSLSAFSERWLRGIALLVAAGALIYLAMLMWSGAGASLESIQRLGFGAIALGTSVASVAYLIRFGRWHLILCWLGYRLAVGLNLRIYLSGLAVTTSPGKLGETIRSLLLLPRGVALRSSLAAFFADRLSDIAGVAALAVAASLAMGKTTFLFESILIGTLVCGGVAAIALKNGVAEAVLAKLVRMPRAAFWGQRLIGPALRWAEVWTVPRAMLCAFAAFFAYGLQALVFAAYVLVLDGSIAIEHSVFIFASSTLIGAASMIPGGLGAMEAAVVYQLTEAGMPASAAVAAAIAHRLSTLWFGIGIGIAALASVASRADTKTPSSHRPEQ